MHELIICLGGLRREDLARCGSGGYAWRGRGGRPTTCGLGRKARARSVALREAAHGGVWNADAVANALLGAEPLLFWKRTRGALRLGTRSGFVIVDDGGHPDLDSPSWGRPTLQLRAVQIGARSPIRLRELCDHRVL